MGHSSFTRTLYESARSASVPDYGTAGATTRKAEQQAYSTGNLDPLVDPSEYGVIRLSLPRVSKKDDGTYELNIGTPMPIETRVDTTGSMGNNVDVAMEVLPDAFELWNQVLPGYDLQIATGIFGDHKDRFPLCRPQFEMEASKIVKQLSLMVPGRSGFDAPEDPDIGIFGGAYLTRAYINRIGLKRYDFTVTDAPGRGVIAINDLKKIYGDEVFNKVKENGYHIDTRAPVNLSEVWDDLITQAHAFILLVDPCHETRKFWETHCGKERVVTIADIKYLPHIQAVIIGLTEGTLPLTDINKFLTSNNLSPNVANSISLSMAKIPIHAQMQLANYTKKPVKGDIFEGKPNIWEDTNLWPIHKIAQNENTNSENDSENMQEDDWL